MVVIKETRTELENRVKAQSAHIINHEHRMKDGTRFKVTNRDAEHVINDALHKTNGKLKLEDIPKLDKYFKKADKIGKPEKDKKKPNSKALYTRYQFKTDSGETLFFIIKSVPDYNGKYDSRLHAITDE